MFKLPAAALLSLALALAWHASPAHACARDPDTGETTCGPPPPPPGCPTAPTKWTTQPRMLLHTSELAATGGSLGDGLLLLSAASDVMNQFNAIGATSARITSVETTTDPFSYEKPYSDPVPTVHVGFASTAKIAADRGSTKSALGLTSERYMGSTCQPVVTIELQDLASTTWAFSSPFASTETKQGATFYNAGAVDPAGGTWFRPSLLHETLHAFDQNHTATQYATMNHRGDGGFPWANRPDNEAMRPLPYDVGLLRARYPASGTRWDVAALDTWFKVTADSEGGAADQYALCRASLGSDWQDETASGNCGDGEHTVSAPGSTLWTRFALANYSTGSVDITAHLWLSRDDTWDSSDVPVAVEHVRHLDAATSKLVAATWTLPTLCSDEYRPIVVIDAKHVNADGTTDPASVKTNWIPLRGKITSTWGCPLTLS